MAFEFHVHGFWILGSVLAVIASMLAGNVSWVEGTTQLSYAVTLFIAFVIFLFVGVCWISAAANTRKEQR